MKKLTGALMCLLLCFAAPAQAQQKTFDYSQQKGNGKWTRLVHKFSDDFYQSEEAVRIGDNVLLYQLETGGWPKNIYMPKRLSDDEYQTQLSYKSHADEGTIDNNATTTEIYYLARLYQATHLERFRKGALDGIAYLLKAQYKNGGWPQCWPRTTGYVTEIQYNDGSNVNVLKLMRSICTDTRLYSFVPKSTLKKVRKAFDRGVDCILKTQVAQNGVPTVWCAQYDHRTLRPAKARAYELISLSGGESHDIVLFLMSLPNPSKAVVKAVDNAVAWIDKNKIEGIRLEHFTNAEGVGDLRVASCSDCQPMWARFYDIETNEPFFCDRDGIKRKTLAEIGHERRNHYSWYNYNGLRVLKEYPQWKQRVGEGN